MALASGQDLYGLCRAADEYPEAYWYYSEAILTRIEGKTKKESFKERRERTRNDRLQKIKQRLGK